MQPNKINVLTRSQVFAAVIGLLFGLTVYLIIAEVILKSLYVSGSETYARYYTVLRGPLTNELPSFIQMLSFMLFFSALMILLQRLLFIINTNKRALASDVFDHNEDTLLIKEDARELRRRIATIDKEMQATYVMRIFNACLKRTRANWSAEGGTDAIKTMVDIIYNESHLAYAIVRYIVWAIPSVGFIGTILGIGQAMGSLGISGDDILSKAGPQLEMAFDTTFVALLISLLLMFLLNIIQSKEEEIITMASDACFSSFVFRMHDENDINL